MFRISHGDITDKEVETILAPHMDEFSHFVYEFLAPEAIAFYLASGYRSSSVWESSFNQHINSVLDMLNQVCVTPNIYKKIKNLSKKILKMKYGLIVCNEEPLNFIDTYIHDWLCFFLDYFIIYIGGVIWLEVLKNEKKYLMKILLKF